MTAATRMASQRSASKPLRLANTNIRKDIKEPRKLITLKASDYFDNDPTSLPAQIAQKRIRHHLERMRTLIRVNAIRDDGLRLAAMKKAFLP